jgi:hypothetical protein
MWEVFNPVNGRPLYRVPCQWMARLLVRLLKDREEYRGKGGLDYAKEGDGW